MEENSVREVIAMELIANSGQARSLAFSAVAKARDNKIEEAKNLLLESKQASLVAHQAQTRLLIEEANGNEMVVNVLLVHAQDHLMTSILAQELIQEIIYLHELRKGE